MQILIYRSTRTLTTSNSLQRTTIFYAKIETESRKIHLGRLDLLTGNGNHLPRLFRNPEFFWHKTQSRNRVQFSLTGIWVCFCHIFITVLLIQLNLMVKMNAIIALNLKNTGLQFGNMKPWSPLAWPLQFATLSFEQTWKSSSYRCYMPNIKAPG